MSRYRRSPHRARQGFLLFEVAVSLVVIAAGLLTVTRSFSISKDAVKRSAQLTEIEFLAQNALWEYEAKGAASSVPKSDVFSENEKYSWRVTCEHAQEQKLDVVTSEVFRVPATQDALCALVTYLREAPK